MLRDEAGAEEMVQQVFKAERLLMKS